MSWRQAEWQGKVQRVLSGEACYFRTWPELIERLEELAELDRGISLTGGE